MKKLILSWFLLPLFALAQSSPPEASPSQMSAGTSGSVYVSPRRLETRLSSITSGGDITKLRYTYHSYGNIANGDTLTLDNTYTSATATFLGATATIALPTPAAGYDSPLILNGVSTSGSVLTLTIPALIRPEYDIDSTITTIQIPATSSGKFTIVFTAQNGTYTKVSAVGDTMVPNYPHSLTFVVNGNGTAVTTGTKSAYVKCPYGGTLVGYTMMCSPSGSITVDVLRSADGAGLPVTSMVGAGTKPAISAGVETKGTTFPSWTSTTVTANDNFTLSLSTVDSVVTYVTLTLYFQ